MPRKRSFRISELQAELIITAIVAFEINYSESKEFAAHMSAMKKLKEKLLTYNWEVKENEY